MNIEDIDISHSAEGGGGLLTLTVTDDKAEKAMRALEQVGTSPALAVCNDAHDRAAHGAAGHRRRGSQLQSLTNRALVAALLADGGRLLRTLAADDTEAMLDGVHTLGAGVVEEGEAIRVRGTGGAIAPGPLTLNTREWGATARFLAQVLALGDGEYVLDGRARDAGPAHAPADQAFATSVPRSTTGRPRAICPSASPGQGG